MMKNIVKMLLSAFVLSLTPTTNVCAQWEYQGEYSEGLAIVVDANEKILTRPARLWSEMDDGRFKR